MGLWRLPNFVGCLPKGGHRPSPYLRLHNHLPVVVAATAKGLISRHFEPAGSMLIRTLLSRRNNSTHRFMTQRFHWRSFVSAIPCLSGRTSSGSRRRAQWPGKHPRSSKCRSAWKSTCMRAPPASKRKRLPHVLTQVDVRARHVPACGV